MRKTAFVLQDSQQARPAASCRYCGRGLYEEDEFYAVNGITVCRDCLGLFAQGQYASCRVTGREWRRA